MQKEPFSLLSLPAIESATQILNKFPFSIDHTSCQFKDVEMTFHNGQTHIYTNGTDLRDFSYVWLSSGWNFRDLAYALHLYLDSTHTRHSYVEKGTSKITDSMIFSLNKLPLPNTVYVSRAHVEQNISLIQKVCGFPLIIKDVKGSRGKYSQYIDNKADLLEKIKLLPKSKKFLFQQYIPNEYDWGILVSNGVVVAGEKSYPSDGEFRNNACNGANECFVDVSEIPQDLKDMAIRASDLLGLKWSRADIIIDKHTQLPYLLEVNRYPGITSGSSEVTGAYKFLASQIAPALV